MPATKTTLTGGKFQDSEGNVLANGYLRLFLNQDEVVTGVGSICSGIFVQIQLDVNGSAVAGQTIWSNDVMTPVNSFYRVFGYAANGQLVWGPNNQQIIFGSGTFDLGTWVPNSVISWQPPIQPLTLEVNGTIAGSQTLLNLNAGSGVTLTDNGSGQVTISAGSTTVFDVNGTPTTSQSMINFQSGSGITVSNPSAGNILFTGPTLKTNGTSNSTQTLLNIAAGSGITASESGGTVTISASGGGSSIQTATLTVTSAQLLALHTNGPLVVAAGIANNVLIPVTIAFNYVFGGIAYSIPAGAANSYFLGWQGDPFGNAQAASIIANGFITQTTNQILLSSYADGPDSDASSVFIGKGLTFGMGASAVNPTAGNGTIVVTVSYIAVPAV